MKETKKNLPNHVAIVPDGNRRWARRRGKKDWQGHEAGAKRIEEITRMALKLGIKNLSFWGSSNDNLKKRPLAEKRALLNIYEKYFKKLIEGEDVWKNKVRLRVLGRWEEQFPKKLTKLLKEGIKKTKKHSEYCLNFLLAYNGDDDMLYAVNKISDKIRQGKEKVEITKETIRKNLITADLPDVDLLIRTGVENDPHNSVGFLMWQTQNSQFYFSDKTFPDFSADSFKEAIKEFSSRERRKGK